MPLLDIIGNKSVVSRYGLPLTEKSCQWGLIDPSPTLQPISIPLDCPPEYDNTLLLKAPHICITEHRNIKFATNLDASSLLPSIHRLRWHYAHNQVLPNWEP